jgi:hypothetical protein
MTYSGRVIARSNLSSQRKLRTWGVRRQHVPSITASRFSDLIPFGALRGLRSVPVSPLIPTRVLELARTRNYSYTQISSAIVLQLITWRWAKTYLSHEWSEFLASCLGICLWCPSSLVEQRYVTATTRISTTIRSKTRAKLLTLCQPPEAHNRDFKCLTVFILIITYPGESCRRRENIPFRVWCRYSSL